VVSYQVDLDHAVATCSSVVHNTVELGACELETLELQQVLGTFCYFDVIPVKILHFEKLKRL